MAAKQPGRASADALARKVLGLAIEQQLEVFLRIAPSILAHVEEGDRARLLDTLAKAAAAGAEVAMGSEEIEGDSKAPGTVELPLPPQ